MISSQVLRQEVIKLTIFNSVRATTRFLKTTNLICLRDVNVDKNKFQLDKNKSFMNVEEIVKYVLSIKKGQAQHHV